MIRTSKLTKSATLSRPQSRGTAILGRVIPELVICGAFKVTAADLELITESLTTSLLSQFNIELLQHAGLLGNRDQE